MINKKRYNQKTRNFFLQFNKKGQEEIIGFVVIVVIVSVIMLVLLSFILTSSDDVAVESYEVESFIQSIMQYTTTCENKLEFLSYQQLIAYCENNGVCLNGVNSCEILSSTTEDIIKTGWNINEQSAIKGYEFKIVTEERELFFLEEGNKTTSYKGSFQDFARSGKEYTISLTIYE
ncbi:hypothetical protein M0R72_09785 [Candidatus Pacearchaeota archaeon]|jgi:hypothetical protein|nr:hypothetical protein [Candidatus Pacearchaeota archaeon]